MNILAIPGSLRRNSFNKRLLEAAVEVAPAGMDIHLFDGLGRIPLFDEDLEETTGGAGNETVVVLREAVARSDAVLFATPEYNQSLPGVLKNGIDWLSRTETLAGRPSAIIGATPGPWGTRYAQKELRHVLSSALESPVMPSPALFVARAATLTDDQGRITDDRTRHALQRFLVALADWADRHGSRH